MNINRRSMIAALGLGGAMAPSVGQSIALQAQGYTVGAGTAAKLATTLGPPPSPPRPAGYFDRTFTSFVEWFTHTDQEEKVRRDASYFTMLDPDIATMHLPMTTKVRWQRERNYEALRAALEPRFEFRLKNFGPVGNFID